MTPSHHRDAAKDMVLGVGITLILFAGSVMMPFFVLVGVFFLPLPVLVCRLKLGRVKGAAVAAIAFAVMAAIPGGGLIDLFPFLALLLMGFLLGESFEHRFSLEKTMLVACGTVALAGLLILFFYSVSAGVSIPEFVSTHVDQNLALFKAEVERTGAGADTMQALTASIELIKEMLKVLPGIALSGILFTAWVSLLLVRPILKRFDLPCPDFAPLIRWRAPEMLVWCLIGSGVLCLIPGALKLVGLNGLLVVLQIYFFQGIAIVAFFLNRKNVPPAVRWLLYTLITFYLGMLVIGLGIFDMWLNVRKLDRGNPLPPS